MNEKEKWNPRWSKSVVNILLAITFGVPFIGGAWFWTPILLAALEADPTKFFIVLVGIIWLIAFGFTMHGYLQGYIRFDKTDNG